ncbi:MAG: DUF4062 domain-containing protein [Prevotella sp.]|jgi:hypothetical protein|nr:DUF4062 domain-containing protein [Prevotella sp.]
MKWENVYIFISSTFNDMHAERDYLVKYVFPELAEWCEARKLRLRDIDLRWGVTSADSEANNTVKVCLENIDACRPFFLCFLGQRRGWTPDMTEGKEVSRETLEEYPELYRCKGNSVTEIEIEHALLAPMLRIIEEEKREQPRSEHALFFFREDNFTHRLTPEQRKVYTNAAEGEKEQGEDVKLQLLKEAVRMSGKTVTHYAGEWDLSMQTPELLTEPNGEEKARGRLTAFHAGDRDLKQIIITQLEAEILKQFPGREIIPPPSTPHEADREQQSLFVDLNMEGYIPQKDIEQELNNYINDSGNDIFLLTAKAGLGKTMLLANYVRRLERDGHTVYARFCGVSDLSSEPYNLWKSIFDEAGIACPPTLNDLRQRMPELLEELSRKGKSIILIDAINQLPAGLDMLSWFPRKLPDGMKLIVSVKDDGESAAVIQSCKSDPDRRTCELLPFDDKKSLIAEHLKKHLKALDDKHIDTICETPASSNPLFMKILLSELRVFGAFKQLETAIKRYGKEPLDAFHAVLQRLETDVAFDVIDPQKSVPYLFGLLSHARKGLSEEELMYCFSAAFPHDKSDKIRGTIRFYLRQMRPFMARREGRTDFLYESFMIAAKERYKSSAAEYHQLLADCFLSFCDPHGDKTFEYEHLRFLSELGWHTLQFDTTKAYELFCNIAYLHACCSAGGVNELLQIMGLLTDSQIEPYRKVILQFVEELQFFPNMLFSTVLFNSDDALQRQAKSLIASGKWRRPWIKALSLFNPELRIDQPAESGNNIGIVPIKRITLTTTVAVGFAECREIAFFTERLGRIRMMHTDTLLTNNYVVSVREIRPLRLFCSASGEYLVVAFEDATADIVAINYGESDTIVHSKTIAQFNYLLPMYEDGAFCFDGNILYYQEDKHNIVVVNLANGLSGKNKIRLPVSGELSALTVVNGKGYISLDSSSGTVILRFEDNTVVAQTNAGSANAVCVAPLPGGKVAFSFTDGTVRVFGCHLEEYKGFRVNRQMIAMMSTDDGLYCLSGFYRRCYLWNQQNEKLVELDTELFPTVRMGFFKKRADGVLLFLSNVAAMLFRLDSKGQPDEAKIIAVYEEVAGNPIAVVRGKQKYWVDISGRKQMILDGLMDKSWLFVLHRKGLLSILDGAGAGYDIDIQRFAVSSVNYKVYPSCQEATASSENGYYFYESTGFLRYRSKSIFMSDYTLEQYRFSRTMLQRSGDRLVLYGESSSSGGSLALFFEIRNGGALHLLGKYDFSSNQGGLVALVALEVEGDNCYFLFQQMSAGGYAIPHTVVFGSVDEFLNGREKTKVLPVRKNNVSLCCKGGAIYINSSGIICAYERTTLAYLAGMASNGAFQLVAPSSKENKAILAVEADRHVLYLQLQEENNENN